MSYIAIQRSIAKGKGLIIFSIVFAVLVRILYYYLSPEVYQPKAYPDAGYLWQFIAPLFGSQIYSMLAAAISVALLAALWNYIDIRNVLLREKSLLAPAFVVLLFSSHTAFFEMSPYLLAALLFLWGIEQLFAAYHSDKGAVVTANISCIIALASLFEPILLLYLVVFIIGFSMVNILNAKSFVSTLLGVIFIYIPAYCISLITNTEEQFLTSFRALNVDNLQHIPILSLNYLDWVLFGLVLFILAWMCIHNYMTSYKDKIRTRLFILFLGSVQFLAVVLFFALNYNYLTNIYIGIATGAMLLAHYFTLTTQRIMVFLFYMLVTVCLLTCYLSFAS